jgi:hypothetical protein
METAANVMPDAVPDTHAKKGSIIHLHFPIKTGNINYV